jgi:hypothetical protein
MEGCQYTENWKIEGLFSFPMRHRAFTFRDRHLPFDFRHVSKVVTGRVTKRWFATFLIEHGVSKAIR